MTIGGDCKIMQIIYDNKNQVFNIKIEPPETEYYYNCQDILELRETFLRHMSVAFNEAICKQLKSGQL